MKKIATKTALFLSITAIVIACSKDDESTPETPKSSEKQILTFVFKATDNEALEQDFEGTVNETDKTITITDLPFAADVTALIPTITVSDKATVDPTSGTAQNFTDDVTYTVTAEDGSEQGYNVTVSIKEITEREALIAIYNANPDNTLGWDIASEDMTTWDGVGFNEIGNVIRLILGQKKLTVIPKEIGRLVNLELFDIFDNSISEIPQEIGLLTYLHSIYLDDNDITEIPNSIGNLIRLKNLGVSNNPMVTIPPQIGNLTKLEYIEIGVSNIESLPVEIGNLTKLTVFNISRSSLKSIPKELGNLTSLEYLYLSDNNLTEVPVELAQLTNLVHLYLDGNNITSIPIEICNLSDTGTEVRVDPGLCM